MPGKRHSPELVEDLFRSKTFPCQEIMVVRDPRL